MSTQQADQALDDGATATSGTEEGTPAKRRLDPGFKRNMKIIGIAVGLMLVLLLLVMLRSGGSTKNQSQAQSQVVLGASAAQTADNLTPEMRKKLEAKHQDEAANAARENRSYVPPDTPMQVVPVAPQAGPGESAFAQTGAPVHQYARGANSEEDTRRREGLNRMLTSLLGEESQSGSGVRQSVRANREDQQASGEAQLRQSLGGNVASIGPNGVVVGGAQGQAAAGAAAPAASGGGGARQIIPGLEIVAGSLAGNLTVPANATVFASARVTSGPAAGGFMVGKARVVDEGLEITFDQLRLGDKTYRVDAIALDEQTAAAAISGNVDRRVLQRYVMPVALAMAQGFANAKAQTGSTVVNVNTGTAGVATPAPSTEQARAAGVSAGLQIASQEVSRQAQAPIVVSREANYPIGVLFRAPVTEEVRR